MKCNKIYIIILVLLVCKTGILSKPVIKVKNIRFLGLHYVSKYEIMKRVRSKITNKYIIIDIESLHRTLKKMPIIKKYTVKKKNNYIIVNIAERKPVILFGLQKDRKTVLYEMDADFTVIAKNAAHIYKPLVIVNKKEFPKGKIQGVIRSCYRLFMRVRKKFPRLYREISEIYITYDGGISTILSVRIRLHNRKPVFYMKAQLHNFRKLRYIAGYLDRKERNPEKVIISGDRVVLR